MYGTDCAFIGLCGARASPTWPGPTPYRRIVVPHFWETHSTHKTWKIGSGLVFALLAVAAQAAPVLPSVTDAGWTTDRYAPASWTNVGAYQGRSNVLGIGINDSTNAANRPAGQQGAFYNTQGRQIAVGGAVGDSIAADLFLDVNWANPQAGFVRSDLWGRSGTLPAEADATYAIIGFTNFGTAGSRLRVWDANSAGGWVNLAFDVSGLFGSWVSFEIESLASGYNYFVNGTLVYTDTSIASPSGAFTNGYLQAFNFNETSVGVTGNPAYVVHWSDPQRNGVPLPGTLALTGLALGLLVGFGKRRTTKI